jgi:hypothetical protein
VGQQAVLQVWEPIFEAACSPHSHGVRPARGPVTALRDLDEQVRDGPIDCVDVDSAPCFDDIPPEPLLDAGADRVADGSVRRLVRLVLATWIQAGARLGRPRAGTPQGGVSSPLWAHGSLAKLDRVVEAEGVRFVREADDRRLCRRHPRDARRALGRPTAVLAALGLRLNQRKTKRVTIYQGVDFLGYRLIQRRGHLHGSLDPQGVPRFRDEVRRLTRRTAGLSLRTLVSRLDRSVRGWGAYWKRAQAAGIFDRLERWITRRLRAYLAKRGRNQLWRREPDPFCWDHLRLTRLDALRRDFLRPLGVRPRAGNRSGERRAGKPPATFVRGTEPSGCPC